MDLRMPPVRIGAMGWTDFVMKAVGTALMAGMSEAAIRPAVTMEVVTAIAAAPMAVTSTTITATPASPATPTATTPAPATTITTTSPPQAMAVLSPSPSR